MIKLYGRDLAGRIERYHEAWLIGDNITEHFGILGSMGQTKAHKLRRNLSNEDNLELVLSTARQHGFAPVAIESHAWLIVEYTNAAHSTREERVKLEEVEHRLDERLGWTGLGHCDGYGFGSGTMEVACRVVDFRLAREVVQKDLAGTKYGDYSAIYGG